MKLLRNELTKLFKKISTYIWLGVVVVVMVLAMTVAKPIPQSGLNSINQNISTNKQLSDTIKSLDASINDNNTNSSVQNSDTKTTETSEADTVEQETADEQIHHYTSSEIAELKTLSEQAKVQASNNNESEIWKSNIYTNLISNKMQLFGMDESSLEYDDVQANELKKTIALDNYRLDHNMAPIITESTDSKGYYTPSGFLGISVEFASLIVSVFAIFLAGSIVSTEFSKGTIKFLLISPYKRWKILLAKYKAIMISILAAMVISYLVANILAYTVYGGYGLNQAYVYYHFGHVHSMPHYFYVIIQFIFAMITPIFLSTISLMIATLTRNGALSTTLGIALLFVPGIIANTIQKLGYAWVKYLPFSYATSSHMSSHLFDTPIYGLGDVTFIFTIVVLLAYFICINAITFDSFCRRDVK